MSDRPGRQKQRIAWDRRLVAAQKSTTRFSRQERSIQLDKMFHNVPSRAQLEGKARSIGWMLELKDAGIFDSASANVKI
jgi:hypothetical protein